jgi:hypothetical protein
LAIALLVGLDLATLAAMALLAPAPTSRFLVGFAGTARAYHLEPVLRGAAGARLRRPEAGDALRGRVRAVRMDAPAHHGGAQWCPGAGAAPSRNGRCRTPRVVRASRPSGLG